ncbi:MAG: 50S ribosomal protein L9 [Butyricicoccus pullicaecorum]|nr:50S ribosomal protein L9 [Butyricicoccus pullicaecorum]MDO4668670.1 50S ribosomal protein L9 [Butyricicoccus pullicaecorum]
MKVILKADVKGQGKKGEMIDVSEGYGRNFLLPRGLAVIANADNMNLKRQADEAAAHRAAVEKAAAEEYAAKLKEVRVKVPAKGGSGGRLFGAVTAKEVSECLKKQHNIDVPKNKIVMEQIKTFGTTIVKAKLYPEIVAEITVDVVEA